MKTFNDLEFLTLPHHRDGVYARIVFANGLGASVIKSSDSYGGNDGLYELAVLDADGEITYDTDVTNDVIGYLTSEMITETMALIQSL